MLSGAFGKLRDRLNRGGDPVTTSASDADADYEDMDTGATTRPLVARGAQWLHNRAKAVEHMSKTIASQVREEIERAGEPRDASTSAAGVARTASASSQDSAKEKSARAALAAAGVGESPQTHKEQESSWMQDWLQAGSPSKEAERKEADESWEVVRAPPHEEEERRMREEERGVREAVARGALNAAATAKAHEAAAKEFISEKGFLNSFS
ncbi:hypothetical protein T484DRAFT_1910419 [Baffinella frigidus]|nr:hypothetical protein T484DRAFT_1910419 [Cryptophyta sp. CCMP2293]